MGEKMIDFEEELKKFHPSLEVDETEDAIKKHDLNDMTDVMLEVFRQNMQNMQNLQQADLMVEEE